MKTDTVSVLADDADLRKSEADFANCKVKTDTVSVLADGADLANCEVTHSTPVVCAGLALWGDSGRGGMFFTCGALWAALRASGGGGADSEHLIEDQTVFSVPICTETDSTAFILRIEP